MSTLCTTEYKKTSRKRPGDKQYEFNEPCSKKQCTKVHKDPLEERKEYDKKISWGTINNSSNENFLSRIFFNNNGYRDSYDKYSTLDLYFSKEFPRNKFLTKLSNTCHIRHFPYFWQLCRKDTFYKNVGNQGFVPLSYTVNSFSDLDKLDENKLYICKLCNSGNGNNIFVGNPSKIKDLINPKNKYIVSDYIKPLLINKRKFEMRIHVVANYSPLVVYIHEFGYVRFASEDYDEKSDNLYCHLTGNRFNYKNNGGNKDNITLQKLWNILGDKSTDIKEKINDVCKKTIFSVQNVNIEGMKKVANSINDKSNYYSNWENINNNCFELFGFDIMLDKNFNIFVLEVNDNPDLSSQYTPFTEVFDVEHLAKYNILNDLFGNNGLLECKTYPERIRHLYKI